MLLFRERKSQAKDLLGPTPKKPNKWEQIENLKVGRTLFNIPADHEFVVDHFVPNKKSKLQNRLYNGKTPRHITDYTIVLQTDGTVSINRVK